MNGVALLMRLRTLPLRFLLCIASAILAACGPPKPTDFRGDWQSVNRFAATTTAIPLNRPYTFFAAPMDGTLRTMLARWAHDTDMRLAYRLQDDYTLSEPVAGLRTSDVHDAAAQLNAIYAVQGVRVEILGSEILVTGASASHPATARQPFAPPVARGT